MDKRAENKYSLAIIVPVLNEGPSINKLLQYLGYCVENTRILLVDGGSTDDTVSQCHRYGLEVMVAQKGRASQMNAGADSLRADIYWFIHADCLPPEDAIEKIRQAMGKNHSWGRFDVRLAGRYWVYRLIGNMMNWRSCITGIATGDQGIFVLSSLFRRVGGFPGQPLMEDIEICRRLRKQERPVCIKEKILVSSRRWQKNGVFKTIMLMWMLRLRYFFGQDAGQLYKIYYGKNPK